MSIQTIKQIFSNNDISISLNFSGIVKDTDHLLTLVAIDPNTGRSKFTTKISYQGAVNLLSELSKIDTLLDKSLDGTTISKIIQTNIDETKIGSFFQTILERPDLAKIVEDNDININPTELSGLLGIKKLKDFISICSANLENEDESFWQKLLEDNVWILQQLFTYPVLYLQGETYVGGKNTKGRNGQGGVATDFLLSSLLCGSFAVIEIKTPKTSLIGSQYRGSNDNATNTSYTMSSDLSGGITQILNQVHTAVSYFRSNLGESFEETNFFHTQAILICGNSGSLDSLEKKKSFSLFRGNSKNVTIITFDELLQKANSLLTYLQSN